VGIVCGIVLALLSVTFFYGRGQLVLGIVWYDYELVSFLIGAVCVLFMARRNPSRMLVTAFALDYGLGTAAIVLMLRPDSNSPAYTFTGTTISMVLVGLLVSSRRFRELVKGFEDAVRPSGPQS